MPDPKQSPDGTASAPAATHETLAAILAEMRDIAVNRDWHNHTNRSNRERVENLADRIEAAAKRERDEDRQLAAIAESDEAFARCARCDRPERATGNFALVRAALKQLRDWALLDINENAVRSDEPNYKKMVDGIVEITNTALSAPARNCDRFDEYHDAVDAWHREERCLGRHEDGGTCAKDPLASTLAPVCFARWLFAPAEGGAE